MRLLLAATLPVLIVAAAGGMRAQAPAPSEPLGISGTVFMPDGAPASEGSVRLRARGAESAAAIGADGRFHLVPHTTGPHEMLVSVLGTTLHRLTVTVPESKTFAFPPVHLQPAAYYRVRVIAPSGEPLAAARLVRQSFDVSGVPIWLASSNTSPDRSDGDGMLTIGPLPVGITTLALDTPPLARMRLPDVTVTGEAALIDGGTVRVERGTTLHVDVVDGAGEPVPDHEVYVEDAAPFAPTTFSPVRTDSRGRATFERLGSGRYQVWTTSAAECARRPVTIARMVTAGGTGTTRLRVVATGNAALRLTSAGVPLRGTTVSLTSESAQPARPPWLRDTRLPALFVGRPFWPFARESPCGGITDAEGRVRLENFPPGPARLAVRLANSVWTARLRVPDPERETTVDVPTGFMPVHTVDARTGAPVPQAALTWTAAGGRVEATASATGDALVEAAAASAGVLSVRASGYLAREQKLPAPDGAMQQVALEPAPPTSLECRIATKSGEAIPRAVVSLDPADPLSIGQVATTDATGSVRFLELSAGTYVVEWHGAPQPRRQRIELGSTTPCVIVD